MLMLLQVSILKNSGNFLVPQFEIFIITFSENVFAVFRFEFTITFQKLG